MLGASARRGMRSAGSGRRDVDDMPRVTAWKILEGQVMTVTLEHRALTYTGALTLQPPGCGPAARARGWRTPRSAWSARSG